MDKAQQQTSVWPHFQHKPHATDIGEQVTKFIDRKQRSETIVWTAVEVEGTSEVFSLIILFLPLVRLAVQKYKEPPTSLVIQRTRMSLASAWISP